MKKILTGIIFLIGGFPALGLSAENATVTGDLSAGWQHLKAESMDLLSVPFTPGDGNLFLTLGVIGATAVTYGYDNSIRDKIETTHSKGLNKATDIGSWAGNPFVHLGVAGLVYGSGVAMDSPKLRTTGEMAAEALLLADASTLLLKEAVGRGRPSATSQKGDFKPFSFTSNYDSFPSMHTASSFALASVLSSTSDSILTKTLYYSAATFVGFSRMYQQKHWTSDVIFAAALGELCGQIVTNLHASDISWKVMPTAYEHGGGIAMVNRW